MSGTIRSVNRALRRELPLRGVPQPTGIFKEPVAGPVRLAGHAVEGDLVADTSCHGGASKAVYTYATEDYAWWEGELGHPLDFGTFGENLTLEGMQVTQARVGERWRVGTAVLEVTQPREPCWKLGARMGEPGFVRRFREAGRPGAYLAIIEEGEVKAGDTAVVLSVPQHPVTVGLLAYLRGRDHESAGLVRALIDQDPTPEEWGQVLAAVDPDGLHPWRIRPSSG